MGLDYVDIFYSHRLDPETPLEETIGALDPAVRQGKALYAGISSYSAERTAEAAAILRELGTPLLIHQPSYSLLNRWIEDGPARRARRARASAASPSRRSPRGCSPTATSTASPRTRAPRRTYAFCAARESSGIPSRYRSVSIPWPSGEKTMQPMPSRSMRRAGRARSSGRAAVLRLVDEQRRAEPPHDRAASACRSAEYDEMPAYSALPCARRSPARPSSPRAAYRDRGDGYRRCRRSPGPCARGSDRGSPSGTCASPSRRRARATCRSRPCWR